MLDYADDDNELPQRKKRRRQSRSDEVMDSQEEEEAWRPLAEVPGTQISELTRKRMPSILADKDDPKIVPESQSKHRRLFSVTETSVMGDVETDDTGVVQPAVAIIVKDRRKEMLKVKRRKPLEGMEDSQVEAQQRPGEKDMEDITRTNVKLDEGWEGEDFYTRIVYK